PARHAARLRAPLDDSAHGALRLALQALAATQAE
ncbi:ATPase, partial [Burkholderia territorii]